MKFFMGRKRISIWCKGEKENEICGIILFQEKSQNNLRIHSQLSIHSLSQVGNHMGTTAPARGAEVSVHKTDTPWAGGWSLVLTLLSLLPLATQWHYCHLLCAGEFIALNPSVLVCETGENSPSSLGVCSCFAGSPAGKIAWDYLWNRLAQSQVCSKDQVLPPCFSLLRVIL